MLKQRWDKLASAMEASHVSGVALMPRPVCFTCGGCPWACLKGNLLVVEGTVSLIMPQQKGKKAGGCRLLTQGSGPVHVYSYRQGRPTQALRKPSMERQAPGHWVHP